MRVLSLLAIFAVASVSAKAAKAAPVETEGLLTCEGAYNLATNSVSLYYNLVMFTGYTTFNFGWAFVPKDIQKTVVSKYDDLMKQVNTLRVQYGLPTFTDLIKDVKSEWNKKVMPQVTKAIAMANSLAAPAQGVISKLLPKFEAEYPESVGLVPTNIFDLLLVLFFLYAVVWGYFVQPLLNLFCCGACSKRKSVEQKKATTASGRPVIKGKKKN